jgi:N-acetylglutamate synthase-like GNAT family acetyltransferase
MIVENYKRGKYLLTTDPKKTDIDAICEMLGKSYWANTRTRDVTEISLMNSLCFNLYDENEHKQIGIARMITDCATYAYLCDVYIEEAHRGSGLGKWLIECILSHPSIKDLKRIDLSTRDAHELYRKFGFTEPPKPQSMMVKVRANN